jgi:hypothetical protein
MISTGFSHLPIQEVLKLHFVWQQVLAIENNTLGAEIV